MAENVRKVCERHVAGVFSALGNQGGSVCSVYHARKTRKVMAPNSGDLEDDEVKPLTYEEVVAELVNDAFGVASDISALGLLLARASCAGKE